MDSPQTAIKSFLDSSAGQSLRDYLLGRLQELGNIANLTEKDTPTHQAIEVKAQLRAYKKLFDIYSEIMTMSDGVKSRDPRDSYSITT